MTRFTISNRNFKKCRTRWLDRIGTGRFLFFTKTRRRRRCSFSLNSRRSLTLNSQHEERTLAVALTLSPPRLPSPTPTALTSACTPLNSEDRAGRFDRKTENRSPFQSGPMQKTMRFRIVRLEQDNSPYLLDKARAHFHSRRRLAEDRSGEKNQPNRRLTAEPVKTVPVFGGLNENYKRDHAPSTVAASSSQQTVIVAPSQPSATPKPASSQPCSVHAASPGHISGADAPSTVTVYRRAVAPSQPGFLNGSSSGLCDTAQLKYMIVLKDSSALFSFN
ncbi:hypothetical protein PIB30_038924 [Stylosanthes scabra]|uniref:Uncharacterized protein n=1 Tax=Stylosanthes scabra TaxID=79078 RepID=A0ABU6RE93_9FABA|nr:hypothetical protein [Stylosanthes scabra]